MPVKNLYYFNNSTASAKGTNLGGNAEIRALIGMMPNQKFDQSFMMTETGAKRNMFTFSGVSLTGFQTVATGLSMNEVLAIIPLPMSQREEQPKTTHVQRTLKRIQESSRKVRAAGAKSVPTSYDDDNIEKRTREVMKEYLDKKIASYPLTIQGKKNPAPPPTLALLIEKVKGRFREIYDSSSLTDHEWNGRNFRKIAFEYFGLMDGDKIKLVDAVDEDGNAIKKEATLTHAQLAEVLAILHEDVPKEKANVSRAGAILNSIIGNSDEWEEVDATFFLLMEGKTVPQFHKFTNQMVDDKPNPKVFERVPGMAMTYRKIPKTDAQLKAEHEAKLLADAVKRDEKAAEGTTKGSAGSKKLSTKDGLHNANLLRAALEQFGYDLSGTAKLPLASLKSMYLGKSGKKWVDQHTA